MDFDRENAERSQHAIRNASGDNPPTSTGPYRRAMAYVYASLILLAGVAAYLLADQRRHIREAAHQNALSIALGLETAATSLLQQPLFSLRGIRTDMASGSPPSAGSTTGVLREAMRFDPVSDYLGVREGVRGEITVVDRAGNPAFPKILASLRDAVPRWTGSITGLRQLIQLPENNDWYLPVTLGFRRQGAIEDVAFALVPAQRLIAGSESLKLIPESRVSLVTTDGTRLLEYTRGLNVLAVNGPPMPPSLLRLAVGKSDVVELVEPVTGHRVIVGYSRSEALPLFVRAVVPVSSLDAVWLREAATPLIVLAVSLAAIGVLAQRLRTTLRRQQVYVAEQEYLATHDTLTGLLNRDAFMRQLEQAVGQGSGTLFAVVLLDLNRFKDINDTLGHAAGDRVLEVLGRRLNALLPAYGARVSRLGGDELAILVHGANSPETLEEFCQRVQACLAETILIDGVELSITSSMGATLYPADAQTSAELIRRADIAMYSGKEELRSFSRYSGHMDTFTPELLALKSEFAKALREGGLSIVYQPKVCLSSGDLVGLEALSRWSHPSAGSVPPAEYVKLAESSELIHLFTQFMLKSVARQVSCWRAVGHSIPVSVNISPNNLLDHTFVEKLREVLEGASLPGHLLELEVTESAVMHHPEMMLTRLRAVRELGVHLSIDDFGTGYASLSYLKRLPVDTLKIDKIFVVNLADDEADQRIVRSSIQLAHGFGMTVVAEGVESREVVDRLREYGCDYAQGFHYSPGVPAAKIEACWLHIR